MISDALAFPQPLFTIRTVENEREYRAGAKTIILNLSETDDILIEGMPLRYQRSAVITEVTAHNVTRALLVENYEQTDPAETFARAREAWPVYYDMSKNPRHMGLLVWRSPKERIFGCMDVNLCAIAGNVRTRPHKTHYVNFTEVHTQLLGYGRMRAFEENDHNTVYRELMLAPGHTHERMYTPDIVYPWHEYESITDAIFMPIEILPKDKR